MFVQDVIVCMLPLFPSYFHQNYFQIPIFSSFSFIFSNPRWFSQISHFFQNSRWFSILPFYWISNFQLHFYPACNFFQIHMFSLIGFSILFVYLQNSSSYFSRAYLDYCGGNCLPTCLLLILNPFADCFPRDISFLQKWYFPRGWRPRLGNKAHSPLFISLAKGWQHNCRNPYDNSIPRMG